MDKGEKVTVKALAEHLFLELGDPDQEPTPEELRESKALGEKVGDIIGRNWGITKARYLGMGAFGIVADLEGDRVLKITTDPMEAELAFYLTGKDLKYVARIHSVAELKGVRVYNWNVREVMDVAALIVERVGGELLAARPEAQEMRELIAEVAHLYNVDALDIMSAADDEEAERRMKGASLHLVQELEKKPPPFGDAAKALKELQDLGFYAVDVNPDNIAYDDRHGIWRVFDLGIALREGTTRSEISGRRR